MKLAIRARESSLLAILLPILSCAFPAADVAKADPPIWKDVCKQDVDLSAIPITLEDPKGEIRLECVKNTIKTMPHKDNDSALGNLSKEPSKVGFIMGHGEPGALCTASSCMGATLISDGTTGKWKKGQQSVKTDTLVLAGCNVGVGNFGRDLLAQAADVLGVPVTAPTGLIVCEDGQVKPQEGSQWPCARPGMAPDLMDRPHHEVETGPNTVYRLGVHESVPASAVKLIWIEVAGKDGRFHCLNLSDEERRQILVKVDFAHPQRGTVVAAITTARFGIALQGTEAARTFDVLSNSAAMEEGVLGVHFLLDFRLSHDLDNIQVPLASPPCAANPHP